MITAHPTPTVPAALGAGGQPNSSSGPSESYVVADSKDPVLLLWGSAPLSYEPLSAQVVTGCSVTTLVLNWGSFASYKK